MDDEAWAPQVVQCRRPPKPREAFPWSKKVHAEVEMSKFELSSFIDLLMFLSPFIKFFLSRSR